MSFTVKLPFTRPKKEERACTNCSFTTRNEVLFQRHIKLCGEASPTKASPVKATAPTQSSRSKSPVGSGGRNYNRNYFCEYANCGFNTLKPRLFLQHRAAAHGEKISIWQCDKCDYASKYKHKLERHTRLVHRLKEITAKEEKLPLKSKRKPAFVTRIRRVSSGEQQRSIPSDLNQSTGLDSDAEQEETVNEQPFHEFIEEVLKRGNYEFLCKVCGFSNAAREMLVSHVLVHSSARQYKCDACEYSSYNKQEYITHKASHGELSTATFSCSECEYTTEIKRNYDRHVANHSKINGPYKCSFCSFCSSTEAAVHRHMGQYHKSKGREMSTQKFRSQTPARKRQTPEPEIGQKTPVQERVQSSCEYEQSGFDAFSEQQPNADIEFETSQYMDNDDEVENEDDEDEDDDAETFGPGELVCGECGFEARTMKTLEKHLDRHVNPDKHQKKTPPKKPPQMQSELPQARPLRTVLEIPKVAGLSQKRPLSEEVSQEINVKRQRTTDSMERPLDLSRSVSPADDLPLKCNYCDYVAKWPSDLRRHLKVHSVDRRFKCRFCGKMYKYSGDVNVHMKKAHPDEFATIEKKEKIYSCRYCDFSTVSKKMYASHFDEHPKVKFACAYCGDQAQSYVLMKTHLEYGHAEELSMETIMLEDVMEKCFDGEQFEEILAEPSDAPLQSILDSSEGLEKINTGPGEWKCPKCPYVTFAKSKLQAHLATHDNLKPFQCPDCGKRSNWKWDIVKHMRGVHPGSEKDVIALDLKDAQATIDEYLLSSGLILKKDSSPELSDDSPASEVSFDMTHALYRCSLCDYESDEITKVELHSRDMHKGLGKVIDLRKEKPKPKLYKCSVCGQRSNWKGDLRKHIKAKHGEGMATIVCCDAPTETAQKVQKDTNGSPKVKKEIGTWPFVCSKCDFKSHKKIEVQQHIEQEHDGTDACVTLQSQFEKDARPYKCPLCTRRSRWHWDLRKHIRNVHPGSNVEPLCQQYKCSICGCISKWHTSVASHLDNEHEGHGEVKVIMAQKEGEDGMVIQEVEEKNNETESLLDDGCNKVWKCVLCSFSCNEKPEAISHLSQSHPKNKYPYSCSLCEFQCNFLSAAYRHLRSRHGENNHNLCIKNLVYVSSDHEATQSLTEESADEQADISLDASDGSSNNVHHEYSCRVCSYTSMSRRYMIRHLRESHGMDNPGDNHMDIKLFTLPVRDDTGDESPAARRSEGKMKYRCTVCPYQTNKVSMFKMHQTHHQPGTPGNDFKCKYCLYYVCAPRLLKQHERLHTQQQDRESETGSDMPSSAATSISIQLKPEEEIQTMSDTMLIDKMPRQARYQCNKCPYMTKSSKDLIYHKQFHHPKPSAPYKCTQCDYWVSRTHLLKQHTKVHEPGYVAQASSTFIIPPSPAKSNGSSSGLDVDTVETASLKHDIIRAKIKSIPVKLADSPESFADDDELNEEMMYSSCMETSGNAVFPGDGEMEIESSENGNGAFSNLSASKLVENLNITIHRCRFCPYGNPRPVNVRMHEEMHGKVGETRFKCPKCDYYSGNMGLMSHHVKVHEPNYNPTLVYQMKALGVKPPKPGMKKNGKETSEIINASLDVATEAGFQVHYNEKTKFHQLDITNLKKYACEKCPYATAKRYQFERHGTLHGSRQKYVCPFCDYSVPSKNLLEQHKRLHLLPNPNLLSAQSINNLQELPEVTADVAMTTSLSANMTEMQASGGVDGTHDHLTLFENLDAHLLKPTKLYRCDRCPYTNVRRDNLLAHLKLHVIQSDLECPYCDYSVSKIHLLSQHVKVHFRGPGIDLDDDIPEQLNATESEIGVVRNVEPEFIDLSEYGRVLQQAGPENLNKDSKSSKQTNGDTTPVFPVNSDTPPPDVTKAVGLPEGAADTMWVCQYCDRAFNTSELLIKHEMQHLTGNKLYLKMNRR